MFSGISIKSLAKLLLELIVIAAVLELIGFNTLTAVPVATLRNKFGV